MPGEKKASVEHNYNTLHAMNYMKDRRLPLIRHVCRADEWVSGEDGARGEPGGGVPGALTLSPSIVRARGAWPRAALPCQPVPGGVVPWTPHPEWTT